MAYTAKDPQRFLYLTETKSWKWEEEGGEEKVSLKTHTTLRGMGKTPCMTKMEKTRHSFKQNQETYFYPWSPVVEPWVFRWTFYPYLFPPPHLNFLGANTTFLDSGGQW